jgi:DNA polymerase-3 subunit gamma/tau
VEYQALYRRWRPKTFDDVVGQEHVTQTIKNEVASGTVGHAFLFCGTRGTGKTSTARILSRAINCTNNKDGNPCNECPSCKGILDGSIMDVVEIDAASNSGVENIRSLREEAAFAAAAVKYKVYIIDEVHALSKDAFNALLKLLEEPPAHVKFVLATTEANKVLETISSRCQRFDFRKITKEDITKRLEEICDAEMIDISHEALSLVATAADGSLRDALSILEPCTAKGKTVDTDYVRELLGIAEGDSVAAVCSAVGDGDSERVVDCIEKVCSSGKNVMVFTEALIKGFRHIMIYAITNKKPSDAEDSQWELLKEAAEKYSADKAIFAVNTLSDTFAKSRYVSTPRFLIEAALLKLCNIREESSIASLEARIGELEKKIASGTFTQTKSAPRPEPEKKAQIKKPIEEKKEYPAQNDDNSAVEAIKAKWPEILSKIAADSKLNLYMSLSNTAIRQFGSKTAIVFADSGGETFRDMMENELDYLTELVREETNLNVSLTVKFESDFEDESKKAEEADPFDEIASLSFVELEE